MNARLSPISSAFSGLHRVTQNLAGSVEDSADRSLRRQCRAAAGVDCKGVQPVRGAVPLFSDEVDHVIGCQLGRHLAVARCPGLQEGAEFRFADNKERAALVKLAEACPDAIVQYEVAP